MHAPKPSKLKRSIAIGLQLTHLGLVLLIALACRSAPASIIAWLCVVSSCAATFLLLARRRSGWVASLGLAGTSTVLFGGWMAASLWAYFSGSSLYRDSPASIIVAVLLGLAGLLPSCLLLMTLLVWRRELL